MFSGNIKLAAGTESVARAGDEVTGFIQIQFQRDGKGNRRSLGGLIVWIVADFGKQLAVYIGFLINLGVLLTTAVDEVQQCL